MVSVAITGGIGSGKSTAANMLAKKPGVHVLNADEEAKRLMIEDQRLRTVLVERFGSETFLNDGSLNRTGLAAKVFDDPEELQGLNALVHPAVRAALVRSIDQAQKDGVLLFVYEVALIKEIDVANILDNVVLVDAPVETRIARVMARNDVSRNDVLARIQHQVSPEELRALADYIIENDGDVDSLQESVDSLYASLTNR